MHNLWPYARFRSLLGYKAALKGVQVVAVDPRDTSKTCSRCGHCDGANRKSQALFRCQRCGYQQNADLNASANIAQRAGSTGAGRRNTAQILGISTLHRPFPKAHAL